MKQGLSP